jgi:hypothetical protein
MTTTIGPELYADLVEAATAPDFKLWLGQVRDTGGCAEPIHLWGRSRTIYSATGEVLAECEPGRLLVACGNRRRSRCPSCSETYRADTFQLIKAGLVGGKTVPDTVAGHPKVFATFTAPSFGAVHHRVLGPNGKVKRCHPHGANLCRRRHRADDPELGQPLNPDTYDYVGAVLWNTLATKLWARTTQVVNRHTARLLGISQRDWPSSGRVSVAKVAEYQSRGVVHFHAIFRLDGPERADPPPAGASSDVVCEAIRQAAATAAIEPPPCDSFDDMNPIVWGEQLDLRPIGADANGPNLTDGQVAGYVAKYATKGAEAAGTIDQPLACRYCKDKGQVTASGKTTTCEHCDGDGQRLRPGDYLLPSHAMKMIETCWALGGLAELECLRLRQWAHMLGFRGHFATKSRRYSTTLGCLRGARQQWRNLRTLHAHHIDPATPVRRIGVVDLGDFDTDQDTVLVVGNWSYTGRGHTLGQAMYARTIAHDITENRRIARHLLAQEAWFGAGAA